jgi:tRNA G10  N-methylase Trm11
MEYVIRFTQCHETFRLAEIEALAVLEGIKLDVISYRLDVSMPSVLLFLLLTMHQVAFLFRQTSFRGSGHQTGQKKHSSQVCL